MGDGQGAWETKAEYQRRMSRAPGEKPIGAFEKPSQYRARIAAAEARMEREVQRRVDAELKRQGKSKGGKSLLNRLGKSKGGKSLG